MKITFNRLTSFYGGITKFKVIINGSLVNKLKNGGTFVYEADDIKTIRVAGGMSMEAVDIPVLPEYKDIQIILALDMGSMKSEIKASVIQDGEMLGQYKYAKK